MCYSAQCWADYRKYIKEFGAYIHIRDFAKLFGYKPIRKRKTPRALDDAFAAAETAEEQEIRDMIAEIRREEIHSWQEALFKQRKRLADAERSVASGKVTKKAQEEVRKAGNKVKQLVRWLNDAGRTTPESGDSRIYSGHFVPVMIWENGRRVVKPMRYRCRLEGWTEEVEKAYPGTYNALGAWLTVN